MNKKVYEEKIIELLEKEDKNIIEICEDAYSILDDANMPDLIGFFVEKIYPDLNKKMGEISNEKMKYIQEASQKYGELLNNIILVLVRKRCTVSEFYMEIWNNFAKLPLLNEQESKGIILLLLCLTPCIPYYAPKNLMSLKEEEYAKYRDQVLGLIIKSKSVIFQPLEQRSERASALLELLDQCASMEEKVVLMSYILAIIEQLREKSTAS
jgi:hypothetical protein